LTDLRLSVPNETAYRARIGLRELRWKGERLFLNGRVLRLHGASLQEDARGSGDALTATEMDAVVARLKAIGANATRAQHGLSQPLLERLDRAGILVWQGVGPFDVPGRWAARTARARALALRRVRLDVLNARAHPSVVAWNLVNEVAYNGDPHGQRSYVRRAAELARRLDPDRPIAVDVWGTHLPSRAGSIYRAVDAVGATNYEGWYDDLWAPAATIDARIRAWTTRLHALFPSKLLVVTEFGAESNGANAADAPGGLGFQARLLARHIRAYQADPRLSGMLAWTLQDFALRPNFLGGSIRSQAPGLLLTRGINAKGLFTYDGRPKPAAATVRRLFQPRAPRRP
jgi:beta-galactosidase/beta-glucuronidase